MPVSARRNDKPLQPHKIIAARSQHDRIADLVRKSVVK
jgi:hypothetical protein